MPSALHEVILQICRDHPELAVALLASTGQVSIPSHNAIEIRDAALSDLNPADYRADLMLTLEDSEPRLGVVVEVQLRPDPDKCFTWPLYAVGMRNRLRCPCVVLVITPSAQTAAWARQPIPLGGAAVFIPIVVGPDEIPVVVDPAAAMQSPELAVLSALAHRDGPDGADAVAAGLAGAWTLDEVTSVLYADIILSGLAPAVRSALEVLMESRRYEYQSDFARKYFGEGKEAGRAAGQAAGMAEGKAEGKVEGLCRAIHLVLASRQVVLTADEQARLDSCSAPELELLLTRALGVSSGADLFAASERQ